MFRFYIIVVAVIYGLVDTDASVNDLNLQWTLIDNELEVRQISVGPAGVWAVNKDGDVYHREGTFRNDGSKGTGWIKIDDVPLTQVEVGANVIWGLNSTGSIFFRSGVDLLYPTGCCWSPVDGQLEKISVSPRGHVWGIGFGNRAFRRVGINARFPDGLYWENVSEGLLGLADITISEVGVWALNASGSLFYREGTFHDPNTRGLSWIPVDNPVEFVTAGRGKVWGIKNGYVSYRAGVAEFNPEGYQWNLLYKKSLVQIDVWSSSLWGVDDFQPAQVYARLI